MYGTHRIMLRPYLVVDRTVGNSQVLLGILALNKLKILVNCELYQWEYKVKKTYIRVDSYRWFQKRTSGTRVYALVKVNYLLRSISDQLTNKFPAYLQGYLDVFSIENVKKLALHRNIDLAIEL